MVWILTSHQFKGNVIMHLLLFDDAVYSQTAIQGHWLCCYLNESIILNILADDCWLMDWFDQLRIFKASNRQRETQTRQGLPFYVIVYFRSHFPYSTGSKQFLSTLREEDYTEAWRWNHGGHPKSCPPKCNIISTVKMLVGKKGRFCCLKIYL